MSKNEFYPALQDQFFNACKGGNIKRVRQLLNKIDPSVNNNAAFREACSRARYAIVDLLLQDSRVDPTDRGNEAFHVACYEGNIRLVKLLLQCPRIDSFQTYMTYQSFNSVKNFTKEKDKKIYNLLTEHQFRLDGPEYTKNIL